eukprot:TRINITY_DN4851_c0_g1_i3.p1 TRINITY_DN4851_c0_g1~~TRINITY_DN4851_c0_g1_i3.p1  ORF type:complete len:401 (-),score=48.26 TRINITY_DN4851_c0_g1_i3:160-1362(-)
MHVRALGSRRELLEFAQMVSVTAGIMMMFVAGVFSTMQLVVSKTLQSAGWPYYKMLALASALASGIFALLAGLSKAQFPERRCFKWVLMRALASNGMLGSMIAAVQFGAPAGDVAALSSVNTVFAALLGRAFLGEPLQLAHIVSLLCCMTGSVLISKPEFLFGSGSSAAPTVAYVMAVVSGLSAAVISISARKAGNTSAWILNTCATFTGAAAFLAMPLTCMVEEPDLSKFQSRFDVGCLCIATKVVMLIFGIGTTTLGAMWCPAAVSATVLVSARLTLGYLTDVLIFGVTVDSLSFCGAVLMLGAVLAMTCARKPAREAAESPPESPEAGRAAELADEDETDSLASFIATEFASERGYQDSVRHRRPTVAMESPASRSPAWGRTLFGVSVSGPVAPGIH